MHRLTTWGRKLYVAYGDYNGNTGPIGAISVDLDTLTVATEATLNTEETWNYRALGGSLYVPYFDPQGGSAEPSNGQYAVATAPGSWTVHTNVGPQVPVHALDIASTSEGLWIAGATDMPDNGATVWHSNDGGATWAADLHLSGPFDRFYCIAAVGDDLVMGRDGAAQTLYYRPSGGTWTTVDMPGKHFSDMTPFTVSGTPVVLVVPSQKNNGTSTAAGPAFAVGRPADSTAVNSFGAGIPGGNALAAATTATHLYLLLADLTVWRCDSTGAWTEVGVVDTPVTCIAADEAGGYLYLGTADSRVLRTTIPA